MVNTFLVHANFAISASWLNSQRLGKQRVEAYQILLLLEDLNELSRIFNIPQPVERSQIKEWIKQVNSVYKKLPYYYVRRDDLMIRMDKSSINSDTQGRVIKLGFVHHPVVRMWVGYESALKEYITAHIDEWIKRGYTNNMQRYEVKGGSRPEWMLDGKIYQNHRASLLHKEIKRSEPSWYINKKEFTQVGTFSGYIWPV